MTDDITELFLAGLYVLVGCLIGAPLLFLLAAALGLMLLALAAVAAIVVVVVSPFALVRFASGVLRK